MISRRTAVGRITVVLGMIAVIVIAAIGLAIESQGHPGASTTLSPNQGGSSTVTTSSVLTSPSPTTGSVASSPQQSVTCTITGQPGPILVRVISDSNQTVAGAQVAATNEPAYCGDVPANSQTTVTFTTAGSQWYSLNSQNNAGYSFVVTYAGHTYDFTAALSPLLATCATLYVPSGRTSISILMFQNSSTACTSTSTTTSSSQQPASLTWYANYGVWNYAVTLTTNQIQPGHNIAAIFTLANYSNETQTMDVVDPLVLPTIYSQNGTVVWAYRPPTYNEIESIAPGHSITQTMTLPTSMLAAGQTYILSSYPGVGTPDFALNIGPYLQLNQTLTVA